MFGLILYLLGVPFFNATVRAAGFPFLARHAWISWLGVGLLWAGFALKAALSRTSRDT